MNEAIVGQVKALLEVTQEAVKENKKLREELQELATTSRMASRNIDDLRGIVYDIKQLIDNHAPEEWMTSGKLAKKLGVSGRTILYWYELGKIPGHKIGLNSWVRFDYREVTEALRKLA